MDGFFPIVPGRISKACGQADMLRSDVAVQLTNTPKLREEAYKIRHEAYLSYNYITPRETEQFQDKYDERRNVSTVLLTKGGIPAATVRVCLFDPSGQFPEADRVPAMEIFDAEIRGLTGAGDSQHMLRAVEITRLARASAFANDKTIIHALFRAVGYLILYYKADIVLNACRPHHVPMYRRFGFQKIAEPLQYPNLTFKAALLACFSSSYGEAKASLPFLQGISKFDQAYESLVCGEAAAFDDGRFCSPVPNPAFLPGVPAWR